MTYPKIFPYLDDEEREIMESVERGEWVPVEDQEAHRKLLQQAAANTIKRLEREKKDSIVVINKSDIPKVKREAKKLGLTHKKALSILVKQFAQGKIKLEV